MKEIIIVVATLLIAGGGGFHLGHTIGEDQSKTEALRHKQRADSLEVEVAKSFVKTQSMIIELQEKGDEGANLAIEAFDILNIAIDSLSIEQILEVKNDPDAIHRLIHGDTL